MDQIQRPMCLSFSILFHAVTNWVLLGGRRGHAGNCVPHLLTGLQIPSPTNNFSLAPSKWEFRRLALSTSVDSGSSTEPMQNECRTESACVADRYIWRPKPLSQPAHLQ